MLKTLLNGKLHLATVTAAELWYEGSCAIDMELIELAGLQKFERIDIYNVNSGARFSTYIIEAEPGSKTISMNGAAARMVQVGDRIIIAAYGQYEQDELADYKPKVVILDEKNDIVSGEVL